MTQPATAPAMTVEDREETRTLFARTMGYVAATAALFALGAFLARDLPGGWGIAAFVAAFGCLIGMQFTAARSAYGGVGLLGAVGLLLGVALAPTLADYASIDPTGLWRAGGATALFIAAFGSIGWATKRDLSAVARAASWALVGLLAASFVLVFVTIPGESLLFSVIGLVIFAGYTAFDFQRLRRSRDISSAPLMAASIFLDVLNVFLFFLSFSSPEDLDA